MKKFFILLIFFTGILCIHGEEIFTLDDCIERGLRNNKELRAENIEVRKSEEKYSEVKKDMFPSISFNGSFSHFEGLEPFEISIPQVGAMRVSEAVSDRYSASISVQQPVFTGFSLVNRVNMAGDIKELKEEEMRGRKIDLIFQIKEAYWNLLKLKLKGKVFESSIASLKEHLKNTRNLKEAGMVTESAVLSIRVKLSEIKLQQLQIQKKRETARYNLADIIGLPDRKVYIVDTLRGDITKPDSLEELFRAALENRWELKAFKRKMEVEKSKINLARSEYYPGVFLYADYLYAKPNRHIFPQEDEFKDVWSVGIKVSLSLFEWGKRENKVNQSELELEKIELLESRLRDRIRLQVRKEYLEVMNGIDEIKTAKKNFSLTDRNYRDKKNLYREGMVLNSEVLDAESDLRKARINLLNSEVDYRISHAELIKSTGKMEEKWVNMP